MHGTNMKIVLILLLDTYFFTFNLSRLKEVGDRAFGCHVWIQQRKIYIDHPSFPREEEN
jgi:hypothetical protein